MLIEQKIPTHPHYKLRILPLTCLEIFRGGGQLKAIFFMVWSSDKEYISVEGKVICKRLFGGGEERGSATPAASEKL